jgi:hypothetical protein
MGTILLHSAWFYLYLLHLAVLTVLAFWLRPPRRKENLADSGSSEFASSRSRTRAPRGGNSSHVARRFDGPGEDHQPLPRPDLGVALSREYEVKFSEAIQRIRLSGIAPTGPGPNPPRKGRYS